MFGKHVSLACEQLRKCSASKILSSSGASGFYFVMDGRVTILSSVFSVVQTSGDFFPQYYFTREKSGIQSSLHETCIFFVCFNRGSRTPQIHCWTWQVQTWWTSQTSWSRPLNVLAKHGNISASGRKLWFLLLHLWSRRIFSLTHISFGCGTKLLVLLFHCLWVTRLNKRS